MHTFLADRINQMTESATLAMAQQTKVLKNQGYPIIDLSIGEPHFPTPLPIQQAAKEAIDSGRYFGYPPTPGYQDLREAIAHKLYQENGIPCQANQVVVSTGAKQSLSNLFLCLLNEGDEVIIYSPYWGSYASMVQLAGGKPVLIQGNQEDNYEPTISQLEQAITSKTKAILFSSPCNPTGLVLSKDHLLGIAHVLNKYKQVLVVADEIYEYINFAGSYTSIGSLPGMQDRVVTVNGFSKSFAMTGWRVGYLAAPLWLAQACNKIQGQLTSATCSIAQRAALAALQLDRSIIQEMADGYARNRDLSIYLLSKIPGFKVMKPLGAFYLFPDISFYFGATDGKTTIYNAGDLCKYLLEKAHVALVAGDSFGDANCIRLSYAASQEDLKTGIQRITQAIAQLQPLHAY
jgi:aspartate aminotransferase